MVGCRHSSLSCILLFHKKSTWRDVPILNFKNKKAMETIEVIVGLAIFLLSLTLLVYIFTSPLEESFDCSANVETMKAWTIKQAKLTEIGDKVPIFDTTPPFKPLCNPIEIKKFDQIYSPEIKDSAYKLLADSMLDCWKAFGGHEKLNFIGEDQQFCYPCRQITFSQDIKSSNNLSLNNYGNYLLSHSPYVGENVKSYYELFDMDLALLPPAWDIPVNKDIYVYFAATKGVTWAAILNDAFSGAKIGAEAGAVWGAAAGLGILSGPGIIAGTTLGAIAGGVTTSSSKLIEKFTTNKEFTPALIIGPAEQINSICNAKALSAQTKEEQPLADKYNAMGTLGRT